MTNKTKDNNITGKKYCLKENNILFKISFDIDGKLKNIETNYRFGYSDGYAFNLILDNALTNNNPNPIIPLDPEEIGLNIDQIYMALGILTLINKKNNIILKYFNFYPEKIYETYFELYKPDFNRFLKDVTKNNNNNIIITVLTIEEHFSLFLFYNNNIYLLDYSLFYVKDETKDKIHELILDLKEYIKNNNYNKKTILGILDSCFKKDNLNLSKELEKNYFFDKELDKKMNGVLTLEKKNSFFFEEKSLQLEIEFFHNGDLCNKVKILNRFAIQGLRSCGYFALASYKLITENNYNIENIINLCKTGLFQIKVVIIVLNEFLKDNQHIILVGNSNLSNEYTKYKNNDIIVGIKRSYHDLNIPIRKKQNLNDIELEKILNIKSFELMLNELGYNKL